MGDDYDIGYGKPPENTRFPKGHSGNPAGRPKGTKSLKADLLEEFAEQIQVREGDHENQISKQRALVKSLMARALKGNDRAAAKLFDLYIKAIGTGDDGDDMDNPLNTEESDILKNFGDRILRMAKDEIENEKEETP